MLLVGIGGICGAVFRVFLGEKLIRLNKKSLPLSTLLINITGAFCLGLLWQMNQEMLISEWVWLLMGTGFLGAYTTFSTFSVESVKLHLNNQIKLSVLYVCLSVILGVIGVYFGMIII